MVVNRASQVALVVKSPPANAGDIRDSSSNPGSPGDPFHGNPVHVFLPGESHGERSLAGYSAGLWGPKSQTRLKRLSRNTSKNGCKYNVNVM